jgi:hypothetical protein
LAVIHFVDASRAVLHGALAIYLIRYLNVPPARLPALGDDRLESMPSTELLHLPWLLTASDFGKYGDPGAAIVRE